MGKPLNNLTIAVTGDFGERRDIHKMKTWIQVNGGIFASEMSSKVTHLVCSKEHFKQNVSIGMSNEYCSVPDTLHSQRSACIISMV